jgi:hypothetical protein
MSPMEEKRADQLVAMARERFDPELREIEVRVLRHSCGYDDPPDWTKPEVAEAGVGKNGRPLEEWEGPEIRPELLRWVLMDADADRMLDPQGLRVWGAQIIDPLVLNGCRRAVRLEFRYCLFLNALALYETQLLSLSIKNSTFAMELDGAYLKLDGSLLVDDVTAAGTLEFGGANIGGQAWFGNVTVSSSGDGLSMQGATIGHDLQMSPKFVAAGRVLCKGIHVGGLFNMNGARLASKKEAINLDNAAIAGAVYLTTGFRAAGSVQMIGAEIGGQLNCGGAKLTSVENALTLDSAKIGGGVFLDEGFESAGMVRMLAAEIGGQLACSGAKLVATGDALWLEGARIDGSVFLNAGFESAGTLRMSGASIEGILSCSGAKLTAAGNALWFDRGKVGGSMFLNKGFESAGMMRLNGVEIKGQLVCEKASIGALMGEGMKVGGNFIWREIKDPEETVLDLMGAKLKGFSDDRDSWPGPGNLLLMGAEMEELHPLGASHHEAMQRIEWLNLQPEVFLAEPQPWMHLAGLLEARGHSRAAKRAVFELRQHQSRAKWKGRRLAALGLRWNSAYYRLEENPFRILWSILFFFALGTAVFWPLEGHFAPTDDAYYKAALATDKPTGYPRFQPMVYALENELPIVKLGQDDKWAPNPTDPSRRAYWLLAGLRWLLILAGWAQGVVLGAAVSERFRS